MQEKDATEKRLGNLKEVHMLLSSSLSLISEQAAQNRDAISKTITIVNNMVNDIRRKIHRNPTVIPESVSIPLPSKSNLSLWRHVIEELDATRRYKLNRYLHTGMLERTSLSLSELYLYEAIDTLGTGDKDKIRELVNA